MQTKLQEGEKDLQICSPDECSCHHQQGGEGLLSYFSIVCKLKAQGSHILHTLKHTAYTSTFENQNAGDLENEKCQRPNSTTVTIIFLT